MSRIVNAKIVNTSISMADHGCLTFFLSLKGDHWGLNYGGYCIGYGYLDSDNFTAENGSGLVAMMRIMDVVGVPRWEELVGKYIRIVDEGQNIRITKIGNIIEDKWFDIDDFFKNYNKEKDENEEEQTND